jgi:hypothetical protein
VALSCARLGRVGANLILNSQGLVNMWKEQFDEYLRTKKGKLTPLGKESVFDFISTEIIEKLINEIPDEMLLEDENHNWQKMNVDKFIKQQLKEKWL